LHRYTIYKYCKTAKGWRYCKPAFGKNNKLKPNVVVVDGREETHPEGMYYLNVDSQWEKAGASAVEGQEAQRKRLARQQYEHQTGEKLPETPNGTPLAVAVERYFSNLEAQGRDPKTIRAYRSAVDSFVGQCKKACVEEITKQDLEKSRSRTLRSRHSTSEKTVLRPRRYSQASRFPSMAGRTRIRRLARSSTFRWSTIPGLRD
jgi:hypothetical protein